MEKILILVDLIVVMEWTLNRRGKKKEAKKKKAEETIQEGLGQVALKWREFLFCYIFVLLDFFVLCYFLEKGHEIRWAGRWGGSRRR